MWATLRRKNCCPSASLSPLSPQPRHRAIHGTHAYAHASGPQPRVFFTTPASRRTAPQMATHDELPHDHPGRAPFLWTRPGPSDMPSPLSTCCRHPTCIPHALRVPQPQPRPHTCAAAPFNASQCVSTRPAPPLLDTPSPSQTRPTRRHHPRRVPHALHVPPISYSFS